MQATYKLIPAQNWFIQIIGRHANRYERVVQAICADNIFSSKNEQLISSTVKFWFIEVMVCVFIFTSLDSHAFCFNDYDYYMNCPYINIYVPLIWALKCTEWKGTKKSHFAFQSECICPENQPSGSVVKSAFHHQVGELDTRVASIGRSIDRCSSIRKMNPVWMCLLYQNAEEDVS